MFAYAPLESHFSVEIDCKTDYRLGVNLLENKHGEMIIVKVLSRSLAAQHNLKIKDRIVRVNDLILNSHNYTEALDLIRVTAASHKLLSLEVARKQAHSSGAASMNNKKIYSLKRMESLGAIAAF
uniref:PDZ domain-containing protein n=1 Tax=Steinernema glaseri TaxID=37863 RepID=A0A1I7Y2N6_9BILA